MTNFGPNEFMDQKTAVRAAMVRSGEDRRKTEQLFRYWEGLRRVRPFPARSELRRDEILHLWTHCFVLPVTAIETLGFSYRGDETFHARAVVFPRTGTGPQGVAPVFENVRAMSQIVAADGKPERDYDAFENRWGEEIKYRAIVLPLGHRPAQVNELLGLISYPRIRLSETPVVNIDMCREG